MGQEWDLTVAGGYKGLQGWQHSVALYREWGCARHQLMTLLVSLVLVSPTVFCSGA